MNTIFADKRETHVAPIGGEIQRACRVKNLVTPHPRLGYKMEIPRLGTEGNLVTALKAGLLHQALA